MSFNSILFIFGFLPAVLAGYYGLALTSFQRLRIPFLILASTAFYARNSFQYLPLLLTTVIANYLVAWMLSRSSGVASRIWLWIGVAGNVAALVWFKYANFLVDNISTALGMNIPIGQIALPLAISFYTFQQISFLVELSRGRIDLPTPASYLAYITFFPQLLAGPISLSREIVPQMAQRPDPTVVPQNILVGLTLFSIGLFKKTVVADTASLWTAPMFDGAAAGAAPAAIAAWGGVLAYTLQIYFDFSGYSDMAIGVGRMFGIVLPLNFHSPFRSTSIVEFWRRWHITLGRFVQNYVFQPIALRLTRFSSFHKFGERTTLILSTLVPTFISMLIIGAWHGANWTFLIFGMLHGSYMVINEIWSYLTRKGRRGRKAFVGRVLLARAATLLAFVIAIVPFRSADIETTWRIFAGMFGLNDGSTAWEKWAVLEPLGAWGLYPLLGLGFFVVYFLPNTAEIMTRITPVLEWQKWRKLDTAPLHFEWRPSANWGLAGGVVLAIGIIFIARGTTQFVYFGF